MIGCNNVLLRGTCGWVTGYCRLHCYSCDSWGWGEGAGLRSSYRQPSSNPHRRIEGTVQISSRTSGRCRCCARKAPLFCSCVQEQSVASFPRQSLLSSFAVRLPWLVSLFLSHFQGESYEVLARYMLNIIFLLPCFFFFFFSNFFFLLDWVHCFTSYLLLVLLFLRQQNGLLWL